MIMFTCPVGSEDVEWRGTVTNIRKYNIRLIDSVRGIRRSIGLKPGFSSSNYGVCKTKLVNKIVNVLFAEEYPRQDSNQIITMRVRSGRILY
jgi:hypothetical protein